MSSGRYPWVPIQQATYNYVISVGSTVNGPMENDHNSIPIYDNHIHMDPQGCGLNAIKEFEAAGGTGLTLVTLPYREVTISEADDFRRSFKITLTQASEVREHTNLKVNVAVGPYPILLIGLAERFGIEEAERIMKKGMDIAFDLVSDGKANVIGEIGRPHFPVPKEITDASQRILEYGMDLARQCDCPVMVHCESEEHTMQWLRTSADSAKLDPGKVIKHLSPPWVSKKENYGIFPSVVASRSSIREALGKGDRFMLETDYIDDPNRPGVVMPITTVPKRIKGLLSSGEMSEELVWKICSDIPSKMYDRN